MSAAASPRPPPLTLCLSIEDVDAVATHVEDVSPEEMRRRMEKAG